MTRKQASCHPQGLGLAQHGAGCGAQCWAGTQGRRRTGERECETVMGWTATRGGSCVSSPGGEADGDPLPVSRGKSRAHCPVWQVAAAPAHLRGLAPLGQGLGAPPSELSDLKRDVSPLCRFLVVQAPVSCAHCGHEDSCLSHVVGCPLLDPKPQQGSSTKPQVPI